MNEEAVAVPRFDPASRLHRTFSSRRVGSTCIQLILLLPFSLLLTLYPKRQTPRLERSMQCLCCDLASCRRGLWFPLFAIYRDALMCTSAYARDARNKENQARESALGALSRHPYTSMLLPCRDETQRPSRVSSHLVLPACFFLRHCSPFRHFEAQLDPSAAGLVTVRQMRNRRRCHVSSVYPAARVFAFGSTCVRRVRGEYYFR